MTEIAATSAKGVPALRGLQNLWIVTIFRGSGQSPQNEARQVLRTPQQGPARISCAVVNRSTRAAHAASAPSAPTRVPTESLVGSDEAVENGCPADVVVDVEEDGGAWACAAGIISNRNKIVLTLTLFCVGISKLPM